MPKTAVRKASVEFLSESSQRSTSYTLTSPHCLQTFIFCLKAKIYRSIRDNVKHYFKRPFSVSETLFAAS